MHSQCLQPTCVMQRASHVCSPTHLFQQRSQSKKPQAMLLADRLISQYQIWRRPQPLFQQPQLPHRHPHPPLLSMSTHLNSVVQVSENLRSYFTLSGASCTDLNGAVSGNSGTFGTLTGQLLAIPAANVLPASQIVCTFTNAGIAPRITLQKALTASGRLAAPDQFRLSATGAGAPAALNTTGAGAAITSLAMNFTATANSFYTLNETMAPGSTSLLTAYAQTVSCTNNNPTGSDFSALTSVPISFTIQAADDVRCTITNNGAPAPTLVIDKFYTTGSTPVVAGQTVIYTYRVTNVGNVSISNVQMSDMHGTPPAAIPTGGTGITGEALDSAGPTWCAGFTRLGWQQWRLVNLEPRCHRGILLQPRCDPNRNRPRLNLNCDWICNI